MKTDEKEQTGSAHSAQLTSVKMPIDNGEFVSKLFTGKCDITFNALTRSQAKRRRHAAAQARRESEQHVLPSIPEKRDFFPLLDPLAERTFTGATPTESQMPSQRCAPNIVTPPSSLRNAVLPTRPPLQQQPLTPAPDPLRTDNARATPPPELMQGPSKECERR